MGWVEDLADSVVGLDTAPLIYYVEANPTYLPRLDPFFDALDRGELQVVTSIVTLIEAMIQPMRRGDAALASRYEDLLLDTAQGAHAGFLCAMLAASAATTGKSHTTKKRVSLDT